MYERTQEKLSQRGRKRQRQQDSEKTVPKLAVARATAKSRKVMLDHN